MFKERMKVTGTLVRFTLQKGCKISLRKNNFPPHISHSYPGDRGSSPACLKLGRSSEECLPISSVRVRNYFVHAET